MSIITIHEFFIICKKSVNSRIFIFIITNWLIS
nr:MAG TPA: hypothetical protein [Bacteriophage sp.]